MYNDNCVDILSVGTCRGCIRCLTCGSEGPIMVNRVSTVRKFLFLLFCHVGFVTSQNPHTWRSGGFNKYARLGRFDRLL